MLASDLNNPEFVGALNPDSLLHVEFYEYEAVDKWASEVASAEAGKRVVKKLPKRDFVRIMRPGDKDTIVETPVREDHKARWPERWLYYEISMGRANGGENIPGWKIDEWPELDGQEELKRDLKYKRFYTVEQLAGAQDAQITQLGIGGLGFREKARAALKERMRKEFAADMREKDETIAAQGAAIAALQKQMETFMASQAIPNTTLHVKGK